VLQTDSWESSGEALLDADGGFAGHSGGARPQTAEVIKTVRERCGGVAVTGRREKADYRLLLEHEGGKPFFLRDNKYVLFDADDDVIVTGSTRSLGNAVKDACTALRRDWDERGGGGQAER
jgi:hypothetical protein